MQNNIKIIGDGRDKERKKLMMKRFARAGGKLGYTFAIRCAARAKGAEPAWRGAAGNFNANSAFKGGKEWEAATRMRQGLCS